MAKDTIDAECRQCSIWYVKGIISNSQPHVITRVVRGCHCICLLYFVVCPTMRALHKMSSVRSGAYSTSPSRTLLKDPPSWLNITLKYLSFPMSLTHL